MLTGKGWEKNGQPHTQKPGRRDKLSPLERRTWLLKRSTKRPTWRITRRAACWPSIPAQPRRSSASLPAPASSSRATFIMATMRSSASADAPCWTGWSTARTSSRKPSPQQDSLPKVKVPRVGPASLGSGGRPRRNAAADGVRHLPRGRHDGRGAACGAARRARVESGRGAGPALCPGRRRERLHCGSR